MMENNSADISKGARVSGYIVSALPSLLLLFSGVMKFVKPPGFAEGLEHLGWTEERIFWIGVMEIACVIIYLIPQTAVLGAILITGYMGGAIATHVRIGDPFWTQIVVGVLVWLGLYLRDARVRNLIPIRK